MFGSTRVATKTFFKNYQATTGSFSISNRIQSDGLGGFHGVSQTLKLGAKKRLLHRRFHFILILLMVTQAYDCIAYGNSCLSIILSLQRSNEAYKNIQFMQHHRRKFNTPEPIQSYSTSRFSHPPSEHGTNFLMI